MAQSVLESGENAQGRMINSDMKLKKPSSWRISPCFGMMAALLHLAGEVFKDVILPLMGDKEEYEGTWPTSKGWYEKNRYYFHYGEYDPNKHYLDDIAPLYQ